jgi:hypothetical protein
MRVLRGALIAAMLSGSQPVARVRDLPPTLPIPRLSGSHDSSSEGLPRGMATLFEPFEIDDLVAAVRSLLPHEGNSTSRPASPAVPAGS